MAPWPQLERVLYDLMAERNAPGHSYAWFIAVAVQRIYGISPQEQRHARAVTTRPSAADEIDIAAIAAAKEAALNIAFLAALCLTLDAALDAERYAATLGRSLSFDTADIRSIAATLYIQVRQEAR